MLPSNYYQVYWQVCGWILCLKDSQQFLSPHNNYCPATTLHVTRCTQEHVTLPASRVHHHLHWFPKHVHNIAWNAGACPPPQANHAHCLMN